MPRRTKAKLTIIAEYADETKRIKTHDEYKVIFETYRTLIELRMENYLTFRSLRIVNEATKRILFEYKDYRYIEKQNYEINL